MDFDPIVSRLKSSKAQIVRGVTLVGASVAAYAMPASAAINTTEITQAMADVATIVDSLSALWGALVSMIVGILPLMIILAIISFILGLFATILSKIKSGGVGGK